MNVEISECMIRGPRELRNVQWPTPEFQRMDAESQMVFFQKCAEEKLQSQRGQFAYSKIRDTLSKTLVEEHIRPRKMSVGGLPKSVYEAQGYVLDSEFEAHNPKQWSEGSQQCVHMLPELTIHEEEVKEGLDC